MSCFFCKGDLIDSTTTHVVNFKKCTIIIKNVPCSECTQCGETYFDDEVAEHLEYIVNSLKSVVAEITVVDYEAKVA